MISWALKMLMISLVGTVAIAIVMDIGGRNRESNAGADSRAAIAHDGMHDGADDDDRDRRRRTVRDDRQDNDSGSGSGRKLRIPAASNGQFYVEAQVDGKTIPFLVDTGASDVVLTREDASRLGFSPGDLDYTMRYQTANGVIRAAPVTLRKIKIRRLALYNIDATVNESPMAISLLGMGFLNELRSYDVKNDTLTMRW